MSFCGLIKGISPKMCIQCVRVKINKRSFEPFCVWILTTNEFLFIKKTQFTTSGSKQLYSLFFVFNAVRFLVHIGALQNKSCCFRSAEAYEEYDFFGSQNKLHVNDVLSECDEHNNGILSCQTQAV